MAVAAYDVLSDARRRRAYMLAGSWWRYVAELERAEEATRQRRGGEARERDARRDEKRQRETWGGRTAESRTQRSNRSHSRASSKKRAKAKHRAYEDNTTA